MIKCKHQSHYKLQFIKTKQACKSKTNYKKWVSWNEWNEC